MHLSKDVLLQQKGVSTEDLNTQSVVQHNSLIESVAKMDTVPLKIFELAVSCIDTDNPPEKNSVYLKKDTIFSFFNANHKNRYGYFKNALTELHKQSYFEVKELEEKDKFRYRVISPIEETEWSDSDNLVKITFTNAIMPYLIDLRSRFTQYAITDIGKLNSMYSIIIYKWLTMSYNQYETYKENGKRTRNQLNQLENPKISIEELRKLTDTEDVYKRFDNFETRVLNKPINEINEKTNFKVSYDKIRMGRRIGFIQFHIEKIKPKAPSPYKTDNEKAYESIKLKIKEIDDTFPKAMSSKYTELLAESSLLSSSQIINKDLMFSLYTKTYPIYEEIEEITGFEGVRNHLEYVKRKMIDYDEKKKNIASYLKKASKSYLLKLKVDYRLQ